MSIRVANPVVFKCPKNENIKTVGLYLKNCLGKYIDMKFFLVLVWGTYFRILLKHFRYNLYILTLVGVGPPDTNFVLAFFLRT
jgi:hypothetical protein